MACSAATLHEINEEGKRDTTYIHDGKEKLCTVVPPPGRAHCAIQRDTTRPVRHEWRDRTRLRQVGGGWDGHIKGEGGCRRKGKGGRNGVTAFVRSVPAYMGE